MMKLIFTLLITVSAVSTQAAAPAANEDANRAAARSMMIEKLARVVLGLPESDTARVGVELRLADLLSERARADQKDELGKGCTTCSSGTKDREQALRYYKEALPKLDGEASARVLLQMGHLHQMNNSDTEAMTLYKRIQNGSGQGFSEEVRAEAELALADIYYKRRQYNEAASLYTSVIGRDGKIAKGYAAYRLAWSDFYQGRTDKAIATLEKVLTTPALLTRSSVMESNEIDPQFQEEISRDLVTFYVQKGATLETAQKIYTLSPEKARLTHLFFLSTELERLGQKKSATEVLTFLQQKENRLNFKLEGQTRLAQLNMEMKDHSAALTNYEKALQLWPTVCTGKTDDLQCREIATRLKNVVIDWHKIEKSNPTPELKQAFTLYIQSFPEGDIVLQGALVAQNLKDYPQAEKWLELATTAFASNADKLETVLLARIELGEMAKDKAMQERSLNAYVAKSQKKSKMLEVEYQLARLIYDRNENEKAANALHAVVMSPSKGPQSLRETAADLSLDALGQMKNDVLITEWSAEYAKLFPAKAKEFSSVSAKASLNRSASVSTTNAKDALKILGAVSFKDLASEDQKLLLKNRILLAEKTENWPTARIAVDDYLGLKGLSTEEKDFGIEHKAYLAELVLDFKTAYAALKSQSKAPSNYRMALMADLAGDDPTPYLQKQLATSTDAKEKRTLASKIILDSKDGQKEWSKHRDLFKVDPEAFADLARTLYARNPSPAFFSAVKAQSSLKATSGYRMIVREDIFATYEKKGAELKAHTLKSNTDRALVASIKERAKLLSEIEKLAKSAVDLGDFTSQLITLDLLSKESGRFYTDLIGLPVPAGLSPEEEQQYMTMLSEQAGPHRTKSEDLAQKVKDFWAEDKAFTELKSAYAGSDSAVRKLLTREIDLLSQAAPPDKKAMLVAMVNSAPAAATVTKVVSAPKGNVESAREDLRKDPLSENKVENLLVVEKKFGATPMVSYLEQRLELLKKNEGKN